MTRTAATDNSLRKVQSLFTVEALIGRRAFLEGSVSAMAVGSMGYLTSIAESLADTTQQTVRRRAAHLLKSDDAEVQVLRDAAKILRAKSGVGSWEFLATFHRDFCGAMQSKEVHFSWYFLPWHRVYLTVFERHLQAAVSEPKLAIPYWDWYSSRAIPTILAEKDNPLLDETRSPEAPEISDGRLGILSEADLVDFDNFQRFAGGELGNVGQLEGGPHGGGHMYAGGNMGAFATAARDPLFLAHHGNIDRLWEVWRGAGQNGPRKEPTDEAWNARPFVFLGPDGNEVGLVSRETVSTVDLGYEYDTTKLSGTLVAQNPPDLALPLGAGQDLALALKGPDGRTDGFELTANGAEFRPVLPGGNDISSALSTASASDVANGFKVSLKFSGIKLSDQPFQLQVYLNPPPNAGQLDPTQPSFAGSLNILATGDKGLSINAYISLNRRAQAVDKPLADIPIVIQVGQSSGSDSPKTVAVAKAELVIE